MQERLDIQFGTETEIGITREQSEGVDVVSDGGRGARVRRSGSPTKSSSGP